MKKFVNNILRLTWRDILWGLILYGMALALLFFIFAKSSPSFVYASF